MPLYIPLPSFLPFTVPKGLPPRGRTPFRFKLNFLLWRSMVKCFSRSLDIERLFREGCRGGPAEYDNIRPWVTLHAVHYFAIDC